jgi:hypothetical protein
LYILRPKIALWVNLGGSCNERCWYILFAIWSILFAIWSILFFIWSILSPFDIF